jgi:putative oxidoreductase
VTNASSGGTLSLVGRILISLIFVISGFFKVAGFSQMVGFLAAKGVPMPAVALALAAATELIGGLALLAGFKTRIAAWLLFLYLIPATLLFHNFWAMHGMEQQDNMAHFMKNLAIMGGLLLIANYGPSAMSVDARSAKP